MDEFGLNERYRVQVSAEMNDMASNTNLTNTEIPCINNNGATNGTIINADTEVLKESNGMKEVTEANGNSEGNNSSSAIGGGGSIEANTANNNNNNNKEDKVYAASTADS